ncbi:hypothetical protein [[Clostridium] symbiosum]|uniref:hypothetical protein n=1 Tax=Clostridium symbiosum TaxID=1512 RepID=UPI0011822CAF|nr:hypothetical protein [[Clostridium] symbiosum]
MRENDKTNPVGGVEREKHIDKISLKNAVETPFWMAVWAAEPERKISVEMSYSDLKIITDLIDDARLKRSRWISVEERLPAENEYRAVRSAHSSKPFLKRLEIAYITDTTEYMFGYYDGYKWMDKCNKEIRNVIAWKIHEPFSQ